MDRIKLLNRDRDLLMKDISSRLPEDYRILDTAYSFLMAFNEACLTGDDISKKEAVDKYNACIWKLNGGTFLACFSGEHSAGAVINEYCSAEDGTIPLWGQAGDFIVAVNGIRSRVKVDGLRSISSLAFSFYAIDLNSAYISETGYRSHIFEIKEILPGETTEKYAMRIIENILGAKKKDIFLTPEYQDKLAAEVLPEWVMSSRPSPQRMPYTLPKGFIRVEAVIPAAKAYIANKWSDKAQKCVLEIIHKDKTERVANLQPPKQHPKAYKAVVQTVEQYREFYVGARCELVRVSHPVFTKNIGAIVKIVTIYDCGIVLAHDDKPMRYRINKFGKRVIEYDPTCIKTFYSISNLKLLKEDESG